MRSSYQTDTSTFRLSTIIDSIVNDYIHKYNGKGYVLFVDKKSPTESVITLGYTLQTIPIDSVICDRCLLQKDHIPLFVFSGFEGILAQEEKKIDAEKITKLLIDSNNLSVVFRDDTTYSVSGNIYPFMEESLEPTVIFEPPSSYRK